MTVFVVVGCSPSGNTFAPKVFDSLRSASEWIWSQETDAVLQHSKSKHLYHRFVGDNTYHVHQCTVDQLPASLT